VRENHGDPGRATQLRQDRRVDAVPSVDTMQVIAVLVLVLVLVVLGPIRVPEAGRLLGRGRARAHTVPGRRSRLARRTRAARR